MKKFGEDGRACATCMGVENCYQWKREIGASNRVCSKRLYTNEVQFYANKEETEALLKEWDDKNGSIIEWRRNNIPMLKFNKDGRTCATCMGKNDCFEWIEEIGKIGCGIESKCAYAHKVQTEALLKWYNDRYGLIKPRYTMGVHTKLVDTQELFEHHYDEIKDMYDVFDNSQINLLPEPFRPHNKQNKINFEREFSYRFETTFIDNDEEKRLYYIVKTNKGNKPVGFITILIDEETKFVDVTELFVKEKYRSNNIAHKVLSMIMVQYKELKYTTITLSVLNNNAQATKVYSKLGFKPYNTYMYNNL